MRKRGTRPTARWTATSAMTPSQGMKPRWTPVSTARPSRGTFSIPCTSIRQ